MVRVVRTNIALPGKVLELLAVAKEIAAVVKGLTGLDLAVCFAFGAIPRKSPGFSRSIASPNSKRITSR